MPERVDFSKIIIGTMRLGKWGAKLAVKEQEAYIESCLEMDCVDFDLADIYGDYTSEMEIGVVLKGRPDLSERMRITTKCGIKMVCDARPSHKVKSYDSSRKHIVESVERSLEALHREHIDILLLHRPDYLMEPQEIAETFMRLKDQGKVMHFGVSNFTVQQFHRLHNLFPLVTNQVELSLFQTKALEDGTLEQCMDNSLQPTIWSPLGGGLIFNPGGDKSIIAIKNKLEKYADQYDCTLDQLLLAWLQKHPAGLKLVVGTSKISRIKSAIEASNIKLSKEDWYGMLQVAWGRDID